MAIFIPCLCIHTPSYVGSRSLLKQYNIEVPKTWDQLYEASKIKNGVYGLSVPFRDK